MRIVPPGDDVVPVPLPLVEDPPSDRFCDVVMTGGVASGVVYPWAIVELARAYRFRSIGGTSVGAMAAALTAAAEYGRRVGFDQSFEALRLTPAALGEVLPDQRTRMLSLFQANPSGLRFMKLWGRLGCGRGALPEGGLAKANAAPRSTARGGWLRVLAEVVRAYWLPLALGASTFWVIGHDLRASVAAELLLVLIGLAVGLVCAVLDDIRDGVIANNLGLCKGGTLEEPGPEGPRPGLCEWLNEGIQAGAGRAVTDRPLTFQDLWCAPIRPGAKPLPCRATDPPAWRAIDLQMITTNVTHGRPYRLPLCDATSRLFYKPAELRDYFPAVVIDALVKASRRYVKASASDPDSIEDADAFLELPGADLPIVVAARLSLSFPLLFSAVPLWAIDYEAEVRNRDVLRRCMFVDGGVSSNFPIHLFDAAVPRWPTFGLWLDRRDPARPQRQQDEDVWLPEYNGQGWGDGWIRFDPEAAGRPPTPPAPASKGRGGLARFGVLAGFIGAIATSASDWHDRTSLRLPHVRNRVARLRLYGDEGGLHIGMPRWQILDMAYRYGVKTGTLFVKRFADHDGEASRTWREQRWVRLLVLVDGLRERLAGLRGAADSAAYSVPLSDAIQQATRTGPIATTGERATLDDAQARSLEQLLGALEALDGTFPDLENFRQVPSPELRLRAPL